MVYSPDANIRFAVFGSIANSDVYATQLAELFRGALPDLYDAVPLSSFEVAEIIAKQVQFPGDECYQPTLLISAKEVVGAVAAYPVREVEQRQRISFSTILRSIEPVKRPEFLRRFRLFSGLIEPLAEMSGVYISRIAVSANFRGMGHGRRLVEFVAANESVQDVYLHVDRQNDHAILFYESLGFHFISDQDYRKRAMVRFSSGC